MSYYNLIQDLRQNPLSGARDIDNAARISRNPLMEGSRLTVILSFVSIKTKRRKITSYY